MRAPVSPPGGLDPYLPDHGDLGYDALHYDLELQYSIASNRLDARARVTIRPNETLSRIGFDLSGLRVAKVAVDGRPARWKQRPTKLRRVHLVPLQ